MTRSPLDTYDTDQPWITYHYGLTHDRWWPIWHSTRMLGRARIGMACMVCGDETVVSIRMPRFGSVPAPAGGRHPVRMAYLAEHAHPDRGHAMSWAKPLRNMAAHAEGLNVNLLAMRLEADLNATDDGGRS